MTLNKSTQQGIGLIEVLIAFVVLTIGILGLVRVQGHFRLDADLSRQRAEATQLAQQEIEQVRHQVAQGGYANLASLIQSNSTLNAGTVYQVKRQVESAQNLKSVEVIVSWPDRSDSAKLRQHQVKLNTLVASTQPVLGMMPQMNVKQSYAMDAGQLVQRSPLIPADAKNLGNGRSAIKPLLGGNEVWLLSNATGDVLQKCVLTTFILLRQLSSSDLRDCEPLGGLLLSGAVRFSLAHPAKAYPAQDTPLPLMLKINLTSAAVGASHQCVEQAVKTVRIQQGSQARVSSYIDTVPLTATPASWGVAQWIETGERYTRYHCLVLTGASAQWSGRSLIEPQGWVIGTQADAYQVCRYSPLAPDQVGSIAKIHQQHPHTYESVRQSLAQQNFLVIRGSETCPQQVALEISGKSVTTATLPQLKTWPYQP